MFPHPNFFLSLVMLRHLSTKRLSEAFREEPTSPTFEHSHVVRRILYRDQLVEDNHTSDATFLQGLRVNPDVQIRSLREWISAVYDSGLLSTFGKVVVFLGVFLLEVDSPFWQRLQSQFGRWTWWRIGLNPIHAYSAVATAALLLGAICRRDEVGSPNGMCIGSSGQSSARDPTARTASRLVSSTAIIAAALGALTPVVASLTAEVSDDTIMALTVLAFLVHVAFMPYGDSKRSLYSSRGVPKRD